MKKFTILFSIIIVLGINSIGQISVNQNRISETAEIILPPIDLQKVQQEDIIRDQHKDIPYRYGIAFNMNNDLIALGSWSKDGDDNVMKITISSVAAQSLELKFNQFYLPEGSSLFFKAPNGQLLRNVVLSAENRKDNRFSSGLLLNSQIIIEMRVPISANTNPKLELTKVIYGYRSITNINKVGDCYIDINCPEGVNWQIEKKAIARILLGSGQYCTGTLVNNTRNDGRKYFLTANHCWEASTDVENWDFYFNYESAACDGITPYVAAVSGSVLRAKNVASDFCLVEITGNIPSTAKPVFAGWDHSGTPRDSSVVIHHPAGTRKKISKDYGLLTSSSWSGCPVGSHWNIGNYELASTEGGSSGAGLFDKNHKIIGQLHGGSALCGNNLSDDYGKFSFSWNYGSSIATRLQEWLDPINSGVTTLDRWSPDTSYVSNDAQIFEIISPTNGYCSSQINNPKVVIRNLGNTTLTSAVIACKINNGTPQIINWNGILSRNQRDTVVFNLLNPNPGTQQIIAYIQSTNLTDLVHYNDTSRINATVTDGQLIHLDIKGRKYYESEIIWNIKKSGVTLYSGSGYTTPSPYIQLRILQDFCLEGGCYTFSITDNNCGGTTPGYYWLINTATGDTIGRGCQSGTNTTLNFCVDIAITPIFQQVPPICQGESIPQLASISTNGIAGIWTPALNNQETTLYTFTPNIGQGNVSNATMTIEVLQTPTTPIVTNIDNILHSSASTGNQWYNQLGSIINATNQDYTATSNGNYYVIVTLLGCSSDPSNTTNIVTTDINDFNVSNQFKVFPTIVTTFVAVEANITEENCSFEITNSIGQLLIKGNFNKSTIVNVEGLATGVYMVKIKNNTSVGTIKIYKGSH
jgi:hypothetical protein